MPTRPSRRLLCAMARASLSNGRDLIYDAETLLAAGRIPRGMALSILATEEISKALLLWTWLSAERRGNAHPPNILLKGLKDHRVKLVMPGIIREALHKPADMSMDDEIGRLTEQLPDALRHADNSNRIKQFAIYVQLEGERITAPSESIAEDHARSSLSLAKSWLAVLEMFEHWLTKDGLLQE